MKVGFFYYPCLWFLIFYNSIFFIIENNNTEKKQVWKVGGKTRSGCVKKLGMVAALGDTQSENKPYEFLIAMDRVSSVTFSFFVLCFYQGNYIG